jgi:dTDP-4-dehydrorhamnose reductase
MKVVLTGATGQLGLALQRQIPPAVELIPIDRHALDLADHRACRALVEDLRPDWILNAGAYTAVDRAESEPDLAMAVNAGAPDAFADALVRTGGRILQISTDFVFAGDQGFPYKPDQAVHPLGVYGATKAAGEQAVLHHLSAARRAHVLRTSWVYGPVGSNFCRTMLRLHHQNAQTGAPLRVVADQVGCPTNTKGLARACWSIVVRDHREVPLPPILHWSDCGVASWYDFAVAIGELAAAVGLIDRSVVVEPIPTSAYPLPAKRPNYSLLDCTEARGILGLHPQDWRQALREVIGDMKR